MKRSLLLAALAVGLVGCGGGGSGSGVSAQRDVEDWLDRLESAYQYGLDDDSSSRFADLISVNYCQDGRNRDDEIDLFIADVQAAQDDSADEVVIRNVRIDNARYENNDNRIQARVRYTVEFYDNGQFVGQIPSFDDSRFVLQLEGSRYRALGSDTGCFLVRSQDKVKTLPQYISKKQK
ncbi:hypothetical protein EON81_10660 [bacterium]|nr:MAG: hypothetical protein EON81_10660 [bacterium]